MATKKEGWNIWIFFLLLLFGLIGSTFVLATPGGPSSITILSNSTYSSNAGVARNESEGGGYIYELLINATASNSRWKAYVGNVSGVLVLGDASGSKIYDWTLTTQISGEVYATRNSTTIDWSNIVCANTTILETENYLLNHTNSGDNVTATFSDSTHSSFNVGTTTISSNSCPTTNTYKNNATQDTNFEEIVLWTGGSCSGSVCPNSGSVIYATILENDVTGYNGEKYDFQMLLPESGLDTWSSSTAYYFYIEIV